MLSDLIAATAEDAQSILSTPAHANVWPTLEAKTVDRVKLASLALLLRDKLPDDEPVIQYMKSFQSLADGGEEGPWIELVPTDLVDDLAKLQDDRVQAVAAAWANTEEARLDGWSAKHAASFLHELSVFAGSARAQGRMVLLWISL